LGPFTSDVGLVAAREVRERIRGKIFRVGTLLILAVVAAAIVIPVLHTGKSHLQQVGVVGALSAPLRAAVVASGTSIGITVHLVSEADVGAAHSDLRSGRVDLVIVDGRELVLNKAIGPTDISTTAQLVRAVSKNLGVAEAFAAAGLSASQSSQLAGAKALPVTSLQRGTAKGATQTTSLVGLILVFVMLTQYNTWILIGVMEEKSSRVVEVLLAAVRPVQLLAGKVLGIGLVAFAQASLIVVFALGLAKAVGSGLLEGTAPLVLVSTLVWLVLGYAFYCWVYAAAGSMAERQDQVQSLAFPLSLPIIFGYIMALTAIGSGSPSTLFEVLAYLPPTAPFAMPVLVGLGSVTWWEFAASAGLSIVCTVGVARLATSIYRRAILRTGRRVQFREIFSRAVG
jgi:ABC-2 type transport system permease protein